MCMLVYWPLGHLHEHAAVLLTNLKQSVQWSLHTFLKNFFFKRWPGACHFRLSGGERFLEIIYIWNTPAWSIKPLRQGCVSNFKNKQNKSSNGKLCFTRRPKMSRRRPYGSFSSCFTFGETKMDIQWCKSQKLPNKFFSLRLMFEFFGTSCFALF